MLDKLIEDRATAIYNKAVQAVKKVAEEEARKIGLNITGSTLLMQSAVNSLEKIPVIAKETITKGLINSLEVELTGSDLCSKPDDNDNSQQQSGDKVYDKTLREGIKELGGTPGGRSSTQKLEEQLKELKKKQSK